MPSEFWQPNFASTAKPSDQQHPRPCIVYGRNQNVNTNWINIRWGCGMSDDTFLSDNCHSHSRCIFLAKFWRQSLAKWAIMGTVRRVQDVFGIPTLDCIIRMPDDKFLTDSFVDSPTKISQNSDDRPSKISPKCTSASLFISCHPFLSFTQDLSLSLRSLSFSFHLSLTLGNSISLSINPFIERGRDMREREPKIERGRWGKRET